MAFMHKIFRHLNRNFRKNFCPLAKLLVRQSQTFTQNKCIKMPVFVILQRLDFIRVNAYELSGDQ